MNFLVGNFGSGKTSYILKKITELSKKNQSFWVIVPSRRQKDQLILELLKLKKTQLGLPIMTFKELQENLFNAFHPEDLKKSRSISNFEKFLLISNIIKKIHKSFQYFRHLDSRPEMIKIIYQMIEQLHNDNINDLKCNEYSDDKISDLQMILSEYDSILASEEISDTKHEVNIIAKNINKLDKEFFPEYIFIDGFISFTAIQSHLIRSFIEICKKNNRDVYISLIKTPHAICNKTIKEFSSYFPDHKIILLDYAHESTKLSNRFLENKKLLGSLNIQVHEIQAFGRHKEIEEIANQIKKLCLFEDHSFEDILIITNKEDVYNPLIASIFKHSEIPFSFGKDEKLSQNPMMTFIKKCLMMMNRELDHETLQFFAQSNYIKNDIRSTLSKSSTYIPVAVKGKKDAWLGAIAQQRNIDPLNNELLRELEEQEYVIKNLCDYLFVTEPYQELPIQNHINNLINLLDFFDIEHSFSTLEDINKYDHIIRKSIAKDFNALLKLKDILKELENAIQKIHKSSLSLGSFIFFFNNIIEETRYRNQIFQKNVVHILNPEDSRGLFKKSVFIIGMNEGSFPSLPQYNLFDNQEREFFNSSLKEKLWHTDNDYFDSEHLSFALAISRAQKNIFFSWTPVNEKGIYLERSHFLNYVFDKNIPIQQIPFYEECKNTPKLHNPSIFNTIQSADSYYDCFQMIRKKDTINQHIKETISYFHGINKANNFLDQGILPHKSLLSYFGDLRNTVKIKNRFKEHNISTSPTKLEKFGRCRYQGLWQIIFKLSPYKLPIYQPEAADYGNLYHAILEQYIQKTISYDYDEKLLDDILKESIKISSNKHIFCIDYNYLKTMLCMFLKKIEPALRKKQDPLFFELESGKKELPNQKIYLNPSKYIDAYCRIDRVDQNKIDHSYSIIDYKKSGFNTYSKYQQIPFHLFQGFFYSSILKINNKVPIESISYIFLEKQKIFKEFPMEKSKKMIFQNINEYHEFKHVEILQLLHLLSEGNFSPFTLESDIGETLMDLFHEKFGKNISREYSSKCSYCDLQRLCLRQNKKIRIY